jgi:hypothetical protein
MRADWYFIGSEDEHENVKVNLVWQTPFIARGIVSRTISNFSPSVPPTQRLNDSPVRLGTSRSVLRKALPTTWLA